MCERGTRRDIAGHVPGMSPGKAAGENGTGRDTPLRGCPMSRPLRCPDPQRVLDAMGSWTALVWGSLGPSGAWLLRGARSPHISACEGFLELEKPLTRPTRTVRQEDEKTAIEATRP